MILKFNGGKTALLCDKCGVILCEGKETEKYIPKKYFMDIIYDTQVNKFFFCSKECCNNYFDQKKKESTIITKYIMDNEEYDFGYNIKHK